MTRSLSSRHVKKRKLVYRDSRKGIPVFCYAVSNRLR